MRHRAYSGGCGVAIQSWKWTREVNVKGVSLFTLSAPSAGSAGFIFILRDSTVFWWRASSHDSHFQRENMGIMAQGKPYVLTAFIFLGFFLLWLKKLEVQTPLGRQAFFFDGT